jgi:thioredoxin 2
LFSRPAVGLATGTRQPALGKIPGQVKPQAPDVDVSPQLSQRFAAQAIPTLLVLRGGQVVARQTGAVPLAALRAWVDKALATPAPGRS